MKGRDCRERPAQSASDATPLERDLCATSQGSNICLCPEADSSGFLYRHQLSCRPFWWLTTTPRSPCALHFALIPAPLKALGTLHSSTHSGPLCECLSPFAFRSQMTYSLNVEGAGGEGEERAGSGGQRWRLAATKHVSEAPVICS